MSKTLKTLLIVLGAAAGILVVVVLVGNRGGRNAPTSSTGLVSSTGAPTIAGAISASTAQPVDVRTQELVQLLNSVSVLRLDGGVFEQPAFQLLNDVSTNLPPAGTIGRNNPFLPIGSDGRIDLGDSFSTRVTIPSSSSNTGATIRIPSSNAAAAAANNNVTSTAVTGQDAINAFTNTGQ